MGVVPVCTAGAAGRLGPMTTSQVGPPLAVQETTHTFPATRLGASLARLAAVARLDDWGVPHGSPLSDTIALIIAELAANAAHHGRVPGRNFELRLPHKQARTTAVVRVEVSDTHPRRPDPTTVTMADPDADGGRGLAGASRTALAPARPYGRRPGRPSRSRRNGIAGQNLALLVSVPPTTINRAAQLVIELDELKDRPGEEHHRHHGVHEQEHPPSRGPPPPARADPHPGASVDV
ncbi:ATP-binding protein [Streptomyces sp. SAI-129]|uniref:ATP-binding protein n=1 Tax=Streptomyces sp. SAI-129 TaxID=3377727 RepID=UPI003C7EA616